MKTLDPFVLMAVFHEMLGPILWVLLLLAAVGIVSAAVTLLREGRIDSKRLVRAELIGLVGGAAALVLTAKVTISGFTDGIASPVDWLLVGLIWGVGLAGTTILSYGIMGMMTACGCRGACATKSVSDPAAAA